MSVKKLKRPATERQKQILRNKRKNRQKKKGNILKAGLVGGAGLAGSLGVLLGSGLWLNHARKKKLTKKQMELFEKYKMGSTDAAQLEAQLMTKDPDPDDLFEEDGKWVPPRTYDVSAAAIPAPIVEVPEQMRFPAPII